MTTATEAVANALEQLRTAKRDFEDESTRVQKSVHDLSQDVKQLREALAIQNDAQTKALLEAVRALRDELKEEADAKNEAQTKALLQAVQGLRDEIGALRKEIAQTQTALDQANKTLDQTKAAVVGAQKTADSAIKDIKFHAVNATIDTTHQDSEVTIAFPEAVDAVALQSIGNDGHDIWRGTLTRIDGRRFKVGFKSARGEGNRWMPELWFLGMHIQR